MKATHMKATHIGALTAQSPGNTTIEITADYLASFYATQVLSLAAMYLAKQTTDIVGGARTESFANSVAALLRTKLGNDYSVKTMQLTQSAWHYQVGNLTR